MILFTGIPQELQKSWGCGCYTLFGKKVIHSQKTAHKQTEDPIPEILCFLLGCYFTAPFFESKRQFSKRIRYLFFRKKAV